MNGKCYSISINAKFFLSDKNNLKYQHSMGGLPLSIGSEEKDLGVTKLNLLNLVRSVILLLLKRILVIIKKHSHLGTVLC